MRTTRAALLLLLATSCGTLFGVDEDPVSSTGPRAGSEDAGPTATDSGVTVTGDAAEDAKEIDPCVTPPSFCEGFDDPTLGPAWTPNESNGTVTLVTDGGEEGGALRGTGPVTDTSSLTFANVSRVVNAQVTSLDCTFRARANAESWNDTFDILVLSSSETPAYSSWFASIWTWSSTIGVSLNSTLVDGNNVQEYPWGSGAIAADQWIDVRFTLSRSDGWILHGSIGDARIDKQLPVPGDALVNPTLHFGLHYGEYFDGSTAMHVDVDRVVCKITSL